MNYRRLNLRLCLWGPLLLGFGLAAGATVVSPTFSPPDTPQASDPALDNVLRGVENKYNRLKTLRLHFRQTYRQDRQALREEEGTLYLRKPGAMRWEYENPEPKLFLTDGQRLTLYVPGENRMTEAALSSSDDLRNPLRFLLGGLHFQKEFQQIERTPDVAPLETGDIVLKAIPKRMKDRLEWVILEVNRQYQFRRMILREPGGIETEFRFDGEVADLQLAPELFRFQPPKGTEIVKQ